MIKLLHFADAHIDIATHGKHDPETGLPIRVLDFLKALDRIVDTAINEKVDLAIFAGDAYKDRTPSPTFQREWGRRMMRLPMAGIPTLLLVGNHDISPASGRAHTLQEFDTLQVPKVRVMNKPELLKPADLWGLPLQVIAIPWVFRSSLMAALELSPADGDVINDEIEKRLTTILEAMMNELDPALPAVLVAHGSVQGAVYGNERTVMLGKDLVLPGSLVKDPRLDYVALGHIHKHQDLIPADIRLWFTRVRSSGLILARPLMRKASSSRMLKREKPLTNSLSSMVGRSMIAWLKVSQKDGLMEKLLAALPAETEITDAIVKLTIEYPRELEMFIDEPVLREKCSPALEFHLIRRPQEEARLRLPPDQTIASLSPLELLSTYWQSIHTQPKEMDNLQSIALSIIQSVSGADQQENPDGNN